MSQLRLLVLFLTLGTVAVLADEYTSQVSGTYFCKEADRPQSGGVARVQVAAESGYLRISWNTRSGSWEAQGVATRQYSIVENVHKVTFVMSNWSRRDERPLRFSADVSPGVTEETRSVELTLPNGRRDVLYLCERDQVTPSKEPSAHGSGAPAKPKGTDSGLPPKPSPTSAASSATPTPHTGPKATTVPTPSTDPTVPKVVKPQK